MEKTIYTVKIYLMKKLPTILGVGISVVFDDVEYIGKIVDEGIKLDSYPDWLADPILYSGKDTKGYYLTIHSLDIEGHTIQVYETLVYSTYNEVVDARIGFDGENYNSLGIAIRSQVEDIEQTLSKKADSDEVVKLSGNQTIEGEKTFIEQMHLEMDDGTTPLITMQNGAGEETGLGQTGFYLNYNTEDEAWLNLPSIPSGTSATVATDVDLASKENLSNKVSSISSSSTDTQYPTAKCVYDELDLKADDSSVVHKTGNETIGGYKIFSTGIDAPSLMVTASNKNATYSPYGIGFYYPGQSERGYLGYPTVASGQEETLAKTSDIPKNIKDGANGSIHQINATNIGQDSVAFGSSVSGSKAFEVTQVSNDLKTYTFNSVEGIGIGYEGNLYIYDGNTDTNYMRFGSVESINGNQVTFDEAIDWTGGLNLQNSYIWFTGYHNIGDVIIGSGAVAEGFNTNATQIGSHSEGINTVALGKYSHAEGNGSVAGGYCSHAEGRDTYTAGLYAFASGRASEGNGNYSFAAIQGKANADNSLAIGTSVEANGNYSIAFGHGSKANGEESVAIGQNNISNNKYAVTIGFNNTASGNGATALNKNNTSSGEGSLATGIGTTASGYASTSFGTGTTASGGRAIAFGYNSVASAATSVAGGATSHALHESSMAFGTRCSTSRKEQVVIGRDNSDNSNALFIIGDGTNENNKHNAFEVAKTNIKVNNTTIQSSSTSVTLTAPETSGTIATTSDLNSKENTSNKVTSLSAQSTDTEYPSAKCVYDLIGDVESLLEAI